MTFTDEQIEAAARAFVKAKYGAHAEWDGLTAEAVPFMLAALSSLGATAAASAGWRPIESAPFDGTEIIVQTKWERVFRARWNDTAGVNADEETCGMWQADLHPLCWTDGYCWGSNEDDEPSDPPVLWQPLPPPPAVEGEGQMGERVERLLRDLAAAIREDIGALPTNVLTLGEEIKLARATSRMSLQEVADAAGFTKSHVWEVEKGRSRNPTIGMIAGLSKALGVPFLRLAQAALNTLEAAPNA